MRHAADRGGQGTGEGAEDAARLPVAGGSRHRAEGAGQAVALHVGARHHTFPGERQAARTCAAVAGKGPRSGKPHHTEEGEQQAHQGRTTEEEGREDQPDYGSSRPHGHTPAGFAYQGPQLCHGPEAGRRAAGMGVQLEARHALQSLRVCQAAAGREMDHFGKE